MTPTNILYDLTTHPEYAKVLREEIQRISAEEPGGMLRKKTMLKLRKLDSFIKESQRVNPLGSGSEIYSRGCVTYADLSQQCSNALLLLQRGFISPMAITYLTIL
jgi:hypothetical protein